MHKGQTVIKNNKKRCNRCLEIKPVDCFYGNVFVCRGKKYHGYRGYCKTCYSKDSVRRVSEYTKLHPEKKNARILTSLAFRKGLLTKDHCTLCGSIEDLHFHHKDYSKPLDVICVCRKCHINIHKNKGLDAITN